MSQPAERPERLREVAALFASDERFEASDRAVGFTDEFADEVTDA